MDLFLRLDAEGAAEEGAPAPEKVIAGEPRFRTCVEVGPGDGFVLRPGFQGTWEVLETTRKEYVVRV